MAVNKQALRKLVEVLRSGEYKQCQGGLTHELKSFCCLGVAEQIRGVQWVRKTGPDGKFVGDYGVENGGYIELAVLSIEGRNYYGFAEPLPLLNKLASFPPLDHSYGPPGSKEEPQLAFMNDQGFTFAQIADLIVWEWDLYEEPAKEEKR